MFQVLGTPAETFRQLFVFYSRLKTGNLLKNFIEFGRQAVARTDAFF